MRLRSDTTIGPQVDFAFSEEVIRHKLSTCKGELLPALPASLLRDRKNSVLAHYGLDGICLVSY